MRSLMIPFLSACWLFLASGQVQAQTPAANFQTLMTNASQAASASNYPMAISLCQQALRIYPTNQQARTFLTQTTAAYNTALTAYTTNLNAGRIALGKSDFQTATTAFTAAGNALAGSAGSLPADATKVATAQHFLAGTAAIQSALTYISNGDFTDAKTSYTTAVGLVGTDQYARVPLAAIRTTITENQNPAPYYAQNLSAGVSAMIGSRFPQAQTYFKTAASLPVGLADQNKAQNYYNAAVALQTAYADLTAKPANYVDAVAQYQTVVTNLTGDANAQVAVTRLNTALMTGLNTEIVAGNKYLSTNDLGSAFTVFNNVTTLATLFPKSTAAQAFLTKFQNQAQLGLAQALNNGSINPATFTVTGNTASSLNVNFQSTTLFIWYLQIPMGTTFTANNLGTNATSTQNMIVLANTNFQVKPNSTNVVPVNVVSMDPTTGMPGAANQMSLNPTPLPQNVLPVLQALQVAQATPRVSQFAVWIVLNPSLQSSAIAVGSTGPTAQELATLVTIFTKAGLNPQNYTALQ